MAPAECGIGHERMAADASGAHGRRGNLAGCPRSAKTDVFEQSYRSRLEALLAPCGLIIDYKLDRAALDLDLHLYTPATTASRDVSDVRVWFQAKGIRTATLSVADFARLSEIPVSGLPVDHVRYWYAAPEPVYLAVYVEAVNRFLAEDIRDIVDRAGGHEALSKLAEAGPADNDPQDRGDR